MDTRLSRNRGCHLLPAILCLARLLCLLPEATAQPAEITIGTITGQLDDNAPNAFQPFTDYLAANIPGRQFRMIPHGTIDDLIDAVDNQELDFAFITPAAFIELNLRHELRPIATITQMAGDTPSPWLSGAVFTLDSRTDIQQLGDAAGRRVVALSQLALGGWLSARREWRDLGMDITRDTASLEFVFSYSAVMDRVCTGDADIGVIAAGTFQSFSSRCSKPLRVLPPPTGRTDPRYPETTSTRLYPEVAFTVIREVDESVVRQLTRALLAIEPGSEVATAANIAGFTAPLTYSPVQELMQELRLGPYSNFGQLTITQALQQNAGVVTFILLALLLLISAGFIRSYRLGTMIRQSESYRKRVFEGSHIAMVVLDFETLTFIDMNPAAVKLYGFESREAIRNKGPIDVSAEQPHFDMGIPEAIDNLKQRLLQEGEVEFEWRHKRPDGNTWDAKVQLMSFEGPEGRMVQATLEDITDQKRIDQERQELELQLQRSQRMESIGRLAGGIAHDFNNLLTVINGYSEVLLADVKGDKTLQNSLQQICKAGQRASDLTNQLLTFSRRRFTQPEPINMNELITESANMFRSVMGEAVKMELHLEPDLGMVLSDSGQLHQVLLNLVVNAKDAMPQGGRLVLGTENRYLSSREAAGLNLEAGIYSVMLIRDTGVGMDKNTIEHIFEPFFSTKGESGTGLGLATVYGIVRQAQGAIVVASEPGAGTTFQILLPQTRAEKETAPDDGLDHSQPARDKTILVVEDQDDVRQYTVSVLEKGGYRVLSACSGPEALALVDNTGEQIDLLLTDVVLEGMHGSELAMHFSGRVPGARILYTSGYADDEVARRGVQQEGIDFLEKPYLPKTLLTKIRQILDEGGKQDPLH